MSQPYKSYSADLVDLRSAPGNGYSLTGFDLGDTIRIIDSATQTCEDLRIVEMSVYLNAPNKNSVVLANKGLKVTDLLSNSKH